MAHVTLTHTFANNSLCPKCLRKCKDLVRYEGCDLCGFKTPQGTGMMSMIIPEEWYQIIYSKNENFKWSVYD